MAQKYNQLRAMWAVTKASLKATFRSPQSVFFSLFFPIVLIWIFGALGSGNGTPSVDVAYEKSGDTTNQVYRFLRHNPLLHFVDNNKRDITDDLKKGKITAILNVVPSKGDTSSAYSVNVLTSSAGQKDLGLLHSIIQNVSDSLEHLVHPKEKSVVSITQKMMPGREYKTIDFFLPGMIGFALIGSAVFGIAFLFYSLRDTLVLKRMYSTPIQRQYIILGESISKVIFNLLTVVVLIAFGHYIYGFYLAHGWITFIDMLPKLLVGQTWIWKSYMELFKNRQNIRSRKESFKKLMDAYKSKTSLFDVVSNIRASVIDKNVTRFKP